MYPMEFHLATLHVTDLEKSLDFYHGLLGIPIASRFDNGHGANIAMLGSKGAPNLELICDGLPMRPPLGAGVSVGFQTQDLTSLIARVKERPDVKIEGPITPNPHICFYFVTDPDGYQVQLLEEKN